MKKAIYAGSFDPLTNGHLWIIEQGVNLFDEFTIAIVVNPEKKYTFSVEDRHAMIEESVGGRFNVEIDIIKNQFLVKYAEDMNAQYILRGIRNESDYIYERGMHYINRDISSTVSTIFMMPPRGMAEISSSFIKGLIGPKGWGQVVEQYVPASVYQRILSKFS
jgi:pantetheine-phosphate adenylyltransferase/8-oxo-dGTP diphosphatase